LERIAQLTNGFKFKKATEPNKLKVPFEPSTDNAELKANIGVLLAKNQNIDLLQYEHYFCQDESKWLLLTPRFHKELSGKRVSELSRYIFCDPYSVNQGNLCSIGKLAKMKPFLELLQPAWKAIFNCGKNITIDKTMFTYKGTLSITCK